MFDSECAGGNATRFAQINAMKRACCFFVFLLWLGQAFAAPKVEYVEHEAIVTFKPGQSASSASRILASHSLTWAKHYDWFYRQRGKDFGLVRDSHRSTAQLIDELTSEPGVECVETNYIRRVSAVVPSDAYFSQ